MCSGFIWFRMRCSGGLQKYVEELRNYQLLRRILLCGVSELEE
jgi:hypothetical protein